MTLHFDNTKLTSPIRKDSEYCFISQPFCFGFCFNFVIPPNKLRQGFKSDFPVISEIKEMSHYITRSDKVLKTFLLNRQLISS